MSAPDESWAEVARDTRAALASLGHRIEPKCLPDETDPCGASFAMHAMAHLATIKGICDHQLGHLGPPFVELHGEIYWHTRADLDERDSRSNHE